MSSSTNSEATLASLRDNGSEIIAIGSVMLALAVVVVILRLVAKSLGEKALGIDDIMICFSLIFYAATEALVLRAVTVGRSAPNVDSPQYVEFAKLTYVYSLLYWSVVTFASVSILLLYRRIFSTQRFFSKASWVLICLTFMWWISGTICESAGFRPVQGYWDTSVVGRYYINYDAFWLTNMITELFLEAAILVLPIREISKVHLGNRKKALIAAMFCMGAFVLGTGIVRIHYVWSVSDMTPGVIWLSVHSSCAIVSACLPAWGPLLARMPGLRHIIHPGTRYDLNGTPGHSTKRTFPSAFDHFRSSPKSDKDSFDGILLDQRSDQTTSGDSHLHNVLESHRKETEPEQDGMTDDGGTVHYGLTKKISVPSPDPAAGSWESSIVHSLESSSHDCALASDGPQTKRAELEFEPHPHSRS